MKIFVPVSNPRLVAGHSRLRDRDTSDDLRDDTAVVSQQLLGARGALEIGDRRVQRRKFRVTSGSSPGIAAGGDEQNVIVRIWIIAFADARLDSQRTIDQFVHALRLSGEITVLKRLRVM